MLQCGWSALILAAENGHKDVVDVLLEQGAEVDLKMIVGSHLFAVAYIFTMPLYGVLRTRSFSDYISIIFTYSSFHQLCQCGISALMMACFKGHATTVTALLEHDARIDWQDDVSIALHFVFCIPFVYCLCFYPSVFCVSNFC